VQPRATHKELQNGTSRRVLGPYSGRCDVVLRKTNKGTHTCTMPAEAGDSHAVGEHKPTSSTGSDHPSVSGTARKITPDWNHHRHRDINTID
jgi:hypothetical protein